MLQQTRIKLNVHPLQVKLKDTKTEEISQKSMECLKKQTYLLTQNFVIKNPFSKGVFKTLSKIQDGDFL